MTTSTVAKISLIFADEDERDEDVLNGLIEVPESVLYPEEWSEELHQELRKLVLGDKVNSILYFGHWIDVRVQLVGEANTTVDEFLIKARDYIYENHGTPDTWGPNYWM